MVHHQVAQLLAVLLEKSLPLEPGQQVVEGLYDFPVPGGVLVFGDGARAAEIVVAHIVQVHHLAGFRQQLGRGAHVLVPHPGREEDARARQQLPAVQPDAGGRRGKQQRRLLLQREAPVLGGVFHIGL